MNKQPFSKTLVVPVHSSDPFWQKFAAQGHSSKVIAFCMRHEGMVMDFDGFFTEYKKLGLSRSSPSRVRGLWDFLRFHGKLY